MGCFNSKAKQTKEKAPDAVAKEPVAIVPPGEKPSNFNVTVVKADGKTEQYVPRPKTQPKQYDKNAHLTLTIEALRAESFKLSGTPNLRIVKLYDQVRAQLGSNGKEFLLFFQGKELAGEEKVLGDFDITADAILDLVYTPKST